MARLNYELLTCRGASSDNVRLEGWGMTTKKGPMGPGYLQELAIFAVGNWGGNDVESSLRIRALDEISQKLSTQSLLMLAHSLNQPDLSEPGVPSAARSEPTSFAPPDGDPAESAPDESDRPRSFGGGPGLIL